MSSGHSGSYLLPLIMCTTLLHHIRTRAPNGGERDREREIERDTERERECKKRKFDGLCRLETSEALASCPSYSVDVAKPAQRDEITNDYLLGRNDAHIGSILWNEKEDEVVMC